MTRRRVPGPRRRDRARHRPAALRRRPPPRGRAPRQARDARRRPGAHRRDRHAGRARRARRAPRHDGRRPAPTRAPLRAAAAGPAGARDRRDEVPRRPRGARSPPTRSTQPRRPRGSSASTTSSCPPCTPWPPRWRRTRRSSRTRRSGRTTRWRTPTSSASTASAGATSTPPRRGRRRRRGPYTFPMVTQFAIEPHAFMAAPDGDGIVVWSAIQHPYWLQRVIADLLGLPLVEGPRHRARPGRRVRRQAAREVRAAASRSRRCALGRPGAARADPRGDVPGRPPAAPPRSASAPASARRHDRLPGHRRGLPDRRVRRHRRPGRGQGLLPVGRPVPLPGRPDRRPERAVAHRPVDRVPRLRQPAAELGGRVDDGRGGPAARHRPARAPAAQPRPARRGVHPVRHAVRRRLGAVRPARGRADRLGRATSPEAAAAGIAVGLKSGPTTGLSYSIVRLLADGCVVVYAGTSDMGQGARTVFAQIAADELGAPLEWVTVVMGDTAVVPYDQQTSASRSTVLMGNAVLAGVPRRPGEARGRWRRGSTASTRREVVVDRGVVRSRRPGAADPRRPRPRARPARRRGHRRRRGAQGGRSRPPARRHRRVLRVQLHRGRGRGRPRDRRRRRSTGT